MDVYEHYKALYTAAKAANPSTPLVPIYSGNDLNGVSYFPPYITYREESDNVSGTMGGGANRVARSSWLFIFYDEDLQNALDMSANLITTLTDAAITTADGYETTASEMITSFTLYDQDLESHAHYVRWLWERSG